MKNGHHGRSRAQIALALDSTRGRSTRRRSIEVVGGAARYSATSAMASRGGTGKAPASSSSEEDPHLSESKARVKQMAEMANLAASRLVGDVDGSTRAAATGALLPADQRATPRAKHGKGSASRGDRAGMRERPMNVVVAPVASSSGGFVASDDDDAGSSHAEARAQLLRLISQHAGEELLGGDDSSSDDGARLGFGNSPLSDGLLKKLTPPKLAMKEIEARKEAAAREAEELMRRQNAVHELLQTVAKQNESRIKRAKEHMAPDGRSPLSSGTVFKPPNSSSDSNDDDATPTAVPAKVVDDDDDAETSQKPWEGDRPWRENIRPSFWEERERRERERKAADSHKTGAANKADLKSRPAWGATIPLEPTRGSHPGKKPAGLEAAQRGNPEDEEKRRAEVKKFLADSKRKWREKIAAEKAELEAKRTHRAAMKKAEDERSRMMAQQAAAERAKRGGDAPAKPKPKPKPMHLEWVDPVDDDAPKSLADLAIPVKPAPAPEVEIPEPVDIQQLVQKGATNAAAKMHAAAEKKNVLETEAEDAKPVITYKPLKIKPKSPEKPVPAPRKESPAKPKPNPLGSFESELVAIQAELDASVDAHAAALALTAAAPRIKRIAAGREDLTRGEDSFSQSTPSSSFAAPTNAKEEAEARRRAGEEAAEKRRQAKVLKDVARRLADTIDNLALAQIAAGGPTSSGTSRDASPVFKRPKPASKRIEVEEARETTSAEEEAAAEAVRSAFRGHVARKGVRAEINAGILKPSRAQTSYTHASGRHITFSPKIDDGGEGGAGGARGDGSGDEVDEDDVEVVFDDDEVKKSKSLVPATSPERQPPMPRPRLLGVKTGRPGTHTVLPNDEHVPKPEDWLAQGSVAHRKLAARLARHRPTLDVDAPYDTGKMSQDKIDALAAAAFGSKEERRAARATETLALPAPTRPQPREPVGIFSLYTRRAAAAAAAAAVSSETARVAEELEKKLELEKDTAVRSSQTEPLALVYERVEAPSPARPAALPAPAEKKKKEKKEKKAKKEKKEKKEKREKKPPTPSPTKPPIEEPTEPAERWARRQLELERREEPSARLALSADLSPRQKAAMTALSAEVSSDGGRPTAGELEHQLRSELNLFDEMGEMAEELSQLQQQQELFQAEQVATALAQALETERERIRKQEENARAQMARAKELEETYVRRAEELEKTAMETAARVREESLRQVQEVTEMFVKSLASGTAVERAAAAELVSRGLPAAGALEVEAAFGSPASVEKPLPEEDEEEHGVVPTVDADVDPDVVLAEFDAAAEAILRGEKSDAAAKMLADAAAATAASTPPGDDDDDDEIEDEIGYVDVRPAPESDDDTSIVDEIGVVERSELSVTASSIPEEFIPHVQGSTRGSKSSSSRGLAVSDEPSPTRSEESFDDRYREVTAKHEEVQRRLRARQKTLRAAEFAAKQAKIREMELELARLEQMDGLTLADEAKFEAEVAEYDVEHKLRAHQERLAQLEETVEAKRLEALALRKMKSVELELAREIHTLDDDIERIGSAAATPLSGGSPIKARLTPVKTSKTSPVKRSGGRPSSPSPEPPLVGEEDIPEESIATEGGSYDSDVFQPIPHPRSPNRSPRSSMGSDTSGGGGHRPHSPLELHPPAHAVVSPPKKKGGSPGKKSGGSGSSSVSEIHSSVSEIHSPETSIRTDAYSEDDFEPPGTDTESAASSGRTVRTRDVTGESPSLSGEAESLLGVLHSHLLGEALDDVAAVAFGEPAGLAADPGSPLSPAPAAEDLVRRATATRAASLARVAIERCGADASALKRLDYSAVAGGLSRDQTAEPANVGLTALADATSRRQCSDRLVFDAVREVLLESLPLVGVYGTPMGLQGRMDGLIEVVSARAATVMDPPHGGRVAVDDVVKDDVKASDDEGWYDVVSTEKAILTRLAEELFDDVVEDTVLSLMFGK